MALDGLEWLVAAWGVLWILRSISLVDGFSSASSGVIRDYPSDLLDMVVRDFGVTVYG